MLGCLWFADGDRGHRYTERCPPDYATDRLINDIPLLGTATGARLDPNLLNPWGIAFFPGK